MLPHRCTQALSWPHLHQHTLPLLQQQSHAFGKAHRLTHVHCPVRWIGRLRLGDPGPGHIGEIGQLRRVPGHRANQRLERGAQRL